MKQQAGGTNENFTLCHFKLTPRSTRGWILCIDEPAARSPAKHGRASV